MIVLGYGMFHVTVVLCFIYYISKVLDFPKEKRMYEKKYYDSNNTRNVMRRAAYGKLFRRRIC